MAKLVRKYRDAYIGVDVSNWNEDLAPSDIYGLDEKRTLETTI